MCPRSIQVYGSVGPDGKQTHGGDPCARGRACAQQLARAGYADAIVVDHRFAFPLPQGGPIECGPAIGLTRCVHAGLDPRTCAPLFCAGLTVYAPLRRWTKPGDTVAVIGIGGLGHLALQFANALGCKVNSFQSAFAR
jgi:uncharacterized zinc-type alcohol dehydrogenase-like protein